jgi:hypothetical protein
MKIALGIPVVDSVPAEAFGHHLATAIELRKLGEVAIFTPINYFPHDRARMMVTEGAREQDCDLLLFVDDDTILPPGACQRLYNTMQEHKAQVVSGHYYRRGYPYTSVWSRKNAEGQWCQVDADKGVYEIHTSGLGCALIDLRWVWENLKPPFYTMGHDKQGTTVTDDISFFDRVREAGGKILGDANVRCVHLAGRQCVSDETVVQLRNWSLKDG